MFVLFILFYFILLIRQETPITNVLRSSINFLYNYYTIGLFLIT